MELDKFEYFTEKYPKHMQAQEAARTHNRHVINPMIRFVLFKIIVIHLNSEIDAKN